MSTAIQLRKRGVVTLPKALRDKYGLDEGDSLYLADLGGVFVLTPMTPMVPQLSKEIERLRTEAGLSTEELLDGLRDQRRRYHAEHYGEQRAENDGSEQYGS